MTQTEALRLALEALEDYQEHIHRKKTQSAITAIKAALEAKDEQPPFNDPAEYDDYDAAVRRNEGKA